MDKDGITGARSDSDSQRDPPGRTPFSSSSAYLPLPTLPHDAGADGRISTYVL